MRLWSIHPKYLDARGLVALWREGLLAQSVLLGKTKGYRNHPQLLRFKGAENPVGAIAGYLRCVVQEADRRGYNFNRAKIVNKKSSKKLPVTTGQLDYEFSHLMAKLKRRDARLYNKLKNIKKVEASRFFGEKSGGVEFWEKRETGAGKNK